MWLMITILIKIAFNFCQTLPKQKSSNKTFKNAFFKYPKTISNGSVTRKLFYKEGLFDLTKNLLATIFS